MCSDSYIEACNAVAFVWVFPKIRVRHLSLYLHQKMKALASKHHAPWPYKTEIGTANMSSEKKRKLAMRTTKLVLQACTIILLWGFSHNPGNFVRDPFNAPLHAHTCTPHAEYNTKKITILQSIQRLVLIESKLTLSSFLQTGMSASAWWQKHMHHMYVWARPSTSETLFKSVCLNPI